MQLSKSARKLIILTWPQPWDGNIAKNGRIVPRHIQLAMFQPTAYELELAENWSKPVLGKKE